MDKKLEEYRARKKREEFITNAKVKVRSLRSLFKMPNTTNNTDEDAKYLLETEEISSTIDDCDIQSDISDDDSLNCCTYADLLYYALCFILWATVYAIFIKLEFGIVYLLVSALLGMYFNTRTRKKRRDEVSAYSVFNRNCESIDGTLKAEQLERQMIYGRIL